MPASQPFRSALRPIESRQNPHLKLLRRVLASPESGLAALEGPNLLAEAVHAGLRIHAVFAAPEAAPQLARLPLDSRTEFYAVPRSLLNPLLATESPQPIAALIEPPLWNWSQLLTGAPARATSSTDAAPLVVVLAGLQDPGNLGTILRSSEAFGATGVLCLPGTVSPWNPKAVRASAGSVFRLPLVQSSAAQAFAGLRTAGLRVWTTSVHEASPLPAADLAGPTALIIGNEGNGVPDQIAAEADATLTIPCPGPVESLNAAIATSILLYEASRQRASVAPTHREPAPGRAAKKTAGPGVRR